jgi:hypothetical protein
MMTREKHIEEARKVFNHIGILNDTDIVFVKNVAESLHKNK